VKLIERLKNELLGPSSDYPVCAEVYAKDLDNKDSALTSLVDMLVDTLERTDADLDTKGYDAGQRKLSIKLLTDLCASFNIDPDKYEVPW
jgi:hypothetical protein